MSRSIRSAFSYTFLGRVLVTVLTAIITPLLTRILGPAQYGRYAVIIAVFGLFQILMTAGITTGSQKFFSEERSIENWEDYVWGYYTRLAGVLASLFALGLSLAAYSGLVAAIFSPEYNVLFYMLAVMAFAVQYRDYVTRTLMGLRLEKYSEPLKVLRQISFGVIAISLASFGFGIIGVLAGRIISSLLIVLIGLAILHTRIELNSAFKPIPNTFPTQELRSFQNKSIIYIFLLSSLYHVDVLMLEGFVTETELGYYKAALLLTELLWVVPKSVQDVMIQSVSKHWRRGNVGKISSIAADTTRYLLLFTLLTSIGIASLATEFVPLYFGQKYSPAVGPFLILLPGTIAFATTRPVMTISQAKGDLRPIILATGFAALTNLLLNALLIPRFGILGGAIATSLGYSSLFFGQVWCASRLGYKPFNVGDLKKVAATCLIAAPVIFGLSHIIHGLYVFLVVPPAGAFVFVCAALLTGAITRHEIYDALKHILGGKSRD